MGKAPLLLISLLIGLALLVAACDPGAPALPGPAARQVLFLAAEGSAIASVQLTAEGIGGQDTWCVVTESETGKERWLLFRQVAEREPDVYKLTVPGGPAGFEALGCTNWDD